MSELRTTSLSHKDNTGTPNITMFADGTTSLPGTVLGGFRNALINGDFRVWERGTAAYGSLSTDVEYGSADRWGHTSPAGLTSLARASAVPAGFHYSATLATDNSARQRVELYDQKAGPFVAGSQWTLSVWANAQIRARVRDSNAVDFLPIGDMTATTETSNGFTRYVATFTMTADATGDYVEASVRNETGSEIKFTGCQLEPGPVATPFEQRPIGTELALCQRYYQKPKAAFSLTGFGDGSGGSRIFQQPLVTTMRANPSVAIFDTDGTQGRVTGKNNAGGSVAGQTVNVAAFADRIEFDGGSNVVTFNGYWINWTADAEL